MSKASIISIIRREFYRCFGTTVARHVVAVVLGMVAFMAYPSAVQAQDISATVAPNISGSDNYVDIKNTTGGNLYFFSAPTPSAAQMARVNSSGISETIWPSVPNFAPDPANNVQNRLYSGEFLRVYPKTLGVNTVIQVEYSSSPAGTRYHYNVTVTSGAQVTSLNIIDSNPTSSASVRWRVTFDKPVSSVTAANFSFNNSANISGLSIASVTADSTQPSSSWTITANTGSGNGLLGLNWTGHQTESPSVPNSFTGQSYDFTFYPIISQDPSSAGINRNSTVTMSIVASLRGGGTLNYQWYLGSSANPGAATPISGANSSSYTPPSFPGLGTFQYFCRAYTTPNNYRDSATAVITVVDPPQISGSPQNIRVATGQTATFNVSASGTSLTYQWYRGTAPSTANPVGFNLSSFTTPALSANTSYWVRISNAGPTIANSSTASATVITSLTPSMSSYSANVNTVFTPALSVTARDSANQIVAGLPVTFTAPSGAVASGRFPGLAVSATVNTDANGVATAPTFTANALSGTYSVVANYSTLAVNLNVTNILRIITSATNTTFLADITNSFTVTTTGLSGPTITAVGALPSGVSLSTAGVLSGVPSAGSGGTYPITITAADSSSPNLVQSFTLKVVEKSSLAARPTFNTNGIGWALNGDTVNGGPTIANNTFTITDGTAGENRSAWFRYPLYASAFQAGFVYQDIGGGGADGVAFVVQNSTNGTTALGIGGGGLGYSGITPSVALLLNIYAPAPGGVGIMLGTNGVGALNGAGTSSGRAYGSMGPINLAGGNPIGVGLRYVGGVLAVTMTNMTTLVTFGTNYTINIPDFVGSSTGWVGITGCEGGVLSRQTVSNFTYVPLATLSVTSTGTGSVLLRWPATIIGLAVQSKSTLSDSQWVTVPAPITQVNGQNQVVIASSNNTEFYRLILPGQ